MEKFQKGLRILQETNLCVPTSCGINVKLFKPEGRYSPYFLYLYPPPTPTPPRITVIVYDQLIPGPKMI